MPNGKPDPNCPECKGTGQITLFTSSSECNCVNRKPAFAGLIKDLGDNPYDDIDFGRYFNKPKSFDIEPIPSPSLPKKTPLKFDPDTLRKAIKKLSLSADYISDGISTWYMWPGIEGHECRGCGATMNVLGMSYNHWCPICDPDGKQYVFHSFSRCGRMPYDYPDFGPSIDTIREGGRRADARRKERERGTVPRNDGAGDGKTG